MKFDIDKILIEWAARVDNGCPDLCDSSHFEMLGEVLKEQNLPEEVITEYLYNLQSNLYCDYNPPEEEIKEEIVEFEESTEEETEPEAEEETEIEPDLEEEGEEKNTK